MTELLGFTLLRPWWLLALLPAAILLVQLHRHGWQHSDWEQLLPRPLHQWLLRRQAGGSRGLRFAALGLTWTLVIVALAGPAVETGAESRRVDDNALVVVLDLSRNMLANDLPPDRMERARLKIRSLIQDYGDSQLSLIVYAGSAHRVTPLSNDHATLTNLLGALSPDIMPSDGQNLGAALDMARQTIAPLPSKGSQILLVTSGLDNGARDVLAEHARQLGPQLSILGVGTRSGAPVPLSEGGFLRDDQGRILLPRLNSQQLGNLAREHGARYHEITTSDRDLHYLLRPLQSSGTAATGDRVLLVDHGHWLVLLLLPIAALGARRGWLGLLLCALLLPQDALAFSWNDLWQRPDQQAMQLLQDQQPAAAAQRFRDPEWRAWALYQAGEHAAAAEEWATLSHIQPDNPEYLFNRGTALAMAGDYSAALEAYEHALTLDPTHQGARHNRDALEDFLEKLREQQEQQQQGDADEAADGDQSAGQNGGQDSGTGNGTTQGGPGAQEAADGAGDQAPGQDPGATGSSRAVTGSLSTDGEAANGNDPGTEDGEAPASANRSRLPRQTLERQQELEQWLREIPDDPAELLRRKFLYQHLQQQDTTP
ncbi:VWA domain-containing protein [Halopseudomonas formosensis]|uniref:VWA domain-containing protein n=1 Tax=Halopseudomonas formosensis TaxID=1002526 RepID=A0ABU5BXR3_9GAMM|nr:VWA domain-containing protein [Halopseudomonas formosensis]MDX9687559.1 VWA domain-containing protein [Halopseudomonas formosensis]